MKMTQDNIDAFLNDQKDRGSSVDTLRHRKDRVWRCKCGNDVELPATGLLLGDTLSCGCMKAENIRSAGKTIAGTHLVLSLKEDEKKTDTLSGHTGVSPKRDKWYAHITYRGKRYNLGTYSNIEDAIKARARAKELVMEDAQKLLELYEVLHKDDYKPDRDALPKAKNEAFCSQKANAEFLAVARSNSSSGYPGVSRSREKWKSYISYQGKRYILGYFDENSEAIAERKSRKADHGRADGFRGL